MFENVNELSVVVAAILSMAVASIWYSPLVFGSIWMKSLGRTLEDGMISRREMLIATIKGVCVQVVFFFVIAQFVLINQTSHISLTTIGTLLTVLIVMHSAVSLIWERRPLSYFFINAGYVSVTLFGGLGIIAFWPW